MPIGDRVDDWTILFDAISRNGDNAIVSCDRREKRTIQGVIWNKVRREFGRESRRITLHTKREP